MDILVIGAGGIGGYFTGRLSLDSNMKVFAALNSNFDLVKNQGLNVKSIRGDFDYKFEEVYHNNQICNKKFDCVILATKALKSINQVELLKNFVHSDDTSILIIQNGIDTELDIVAAFPNNEIVSAVAYIGVCKADGNQILHTGGEGSLQIGKVNKEQVSDKIHSLVDAWKNQSVVASVVPNIRATKYEKLLWNIPFNSLSVIGDELMTNEMTDGAEIEELCRNLMHEVIDIAQSDNVVLPRTLVDDKINYTRNFPPYATSMLVDYQNHRKLEVQAILGNILNIATKNSVIVPHIRTIYALLQAIDKKI